MALNGYRGALKAASSVKGGQRGEAVVVDDLRRLRVGDLRR